MSSNIARRMAETLFAGLIASTALALGFALRVVIDATGGSLPLAVAETAAFASWVYWSVRLFHFWRLVRRVEPLRVPSTFTYGDDAA